MTKKQKFIETLKLIKKANSNFASGCFIPLFIFDYIVTRDFFVLIAFFWFELSQIGFWIIKDQLKLIDDLFSDLKKTVEFIGEIQTFIKKESKQKKGPHKTRPH